MQQGDSLLFIRRHLCGHLQRMQNIFKPGFIRLSGMRRFRYFKRQFFQHDGTILLIHYKRLC